jgi:hypothetical protein
VTSVETQQTTVSGRLAIAVLEWLDASGYLKASSDLCLVYTVANLDDEPLPAEVTMSGGRRWRLAAADGDFGLRVALVNAGGMPVFAFTNKNEKMFGADLHERAVLRYTIRPLARHIFSALVGVEASALDDERFLTPLTEVLGSPRKRDLVRAIAGRTWGRVIRENDATAVLCQAAFGFDDRYAEPQAGELWAQWLREPPLVTPALRLLAAELLSSRYPLYAKILESTSDGSPQTAFARIARHDEISDRIEKNLARDAGRRLRRSSPERLDLLLSEAEAAYARAGSPLTEAWLLRGAFAAQARTLGIRARSESPPSTLEIGTLEQYLYDEPNLRENLIRLARVGRGLCALEAAPIPETIADYAESWCRDLSWLDRAARRLREANFADGETILVANQILERWYRLRDNWNAAFAQRLVSDWNSLFATPGEGAPYVVSHLLKHQVRPLLVKGRRVFLIVLDGCDLPTFLEISDSFARSGIALPQTCVALSAIPTVTSHARRAIFMGEIPIGGISDDDEASDPKTDLQAFGETNEFLKGFSRKLYLKGELGDEGAALADVLSHPARAPQFIAAVFNDVDDAIASKEHGVLPERTMERCSKAFQAAMNAAFDNDWHILITADHGHTPYRAPDLKLALGHARFSELGPRDVPPTGTVVFEKTHFMPYRIAAAYQVGAHMGPQHLGYHGGVSLEEMFVPLATYDRAATNVSPLLPPAWWDDILDVVRVSERAGVLAQPGIGTPRSLEPLPLIHSPSNGDVTGDAEIMYVASARAILKAKPRELEIFDRVLTGAMLSGEQLATVLSVRAGRLRTIVVGLNNALEDAGLAPAILIEDEPIVFRWIGTK